MKNRKLIPRISLILATIVLSATLAHLYSQKIKAHEPSPDKGIQQGAIAGLHKRLAEALSRVRVHPDAEGKYSFTLSSGSFFDMTERTQLIYDKKAMVYMNQGKISKIVFEYYQYSFANQIREVKTFTNVSSDINDMNSMQFNYVASTGETRSYRVGDLQSSHSRDDVVAQYSSYLQSLVDRLELGIQKNKNIESMKIERTIQLGK